MDDKTPEQIAAELEMQSRTHLAEEQAAKEVLEEKKQRAGELHFVIEDRVFKPILTKVFIPGIGDRTALEICIDDEAQKYLIDENCIGSVIEEII